MGTETLYHVVRRSTIAGLEDRVKWHLDRGWELQGGVGVTANGDFVQALVLRRTT